MPLIDDRGNLFGRVNVIDALVVLLLLAVIGGGSALVLTSGQADDGIDTTELVVELRSEKVEPYVAAAIPEGQIEADSVVAIRSKTVEPTAVVVADRNGQLYERDHPRLKTVTFEAVLVTDATTDTPEFNGAPLYVGRELVLDLNTVRVTGNVTSVGAVR